MHALRIEGKELELRVVSGSRNAGPLTAQPLKNGHGKCRPFDGVGTGAQLIKQHKAVFVVGGKDVHNGCNVA
ncbi:hypothetical protein SDC9_199072 [bioreactor metagenome]|uniref:Uncharacterized protein n=1 Tax=bioreactor metagenome TaxID=1076179 RepID=A0A645IJH1_9ZZZZ